MSTSQQTENTYKVSIGDRLRRTREERGITYADASGATKLKTSYLEALERNRFDDLPAPIYTKNFLRIYGNYLGLDGQALSDEFGQQTSTEIVLPPHSRTTPTYYITLFVSTLIRHKFVTLILLVVLAGGSIHFCTKSDTSYTPSPTLKPSPSAREEVEKYKPVVDMNDLLPVRK